MMMTMTSSLLTNRSRPVTSSCGGQLSSGSTLMGRSMSAAGLEPTVDPVLAWRLGGVELAVASSVTVNWRSVGPVSCPLWTSRTSPASTCAGHHASTEATLPQTDRATRCASRNRVRLLHNCRNTHMCGMGYSWHAKPATSAVDILNLKSQGAAAMQTPPTGTVATCCS